MELEQHEEPQKPNSGYSNATRVLATYIIWSFGIFFVLAIISGIFAFSSCTGASSDSNCIGNVGLGWAILNGSLSAPIAVIVGLIMAYLRHRKLYPSTTPIISNPDGNSNGNNVNIESPKKRYIARYVIIVFLSITVLELIIWLFKFLPLLFY